MQRVEVEEVEPDGLDSTWAPGDQPRSVLSSSATITGSPAPSPFLWGEETPRDLRGLASRGEAAVGAVVV